MSIAVLSFADTVFDVAVSRFHVVERMSSLFRVTVDAKSSIYDLDLDPLLGIEARFRVEGGTFLPIATQRVWTGRAIRVESVRQEMLGLSTYRFTLVPHLWRLTKRTTNRLFQHASIPTIVEQILAEWAIAHQWRVAPELYPKLELRTQYNETDFAFLSRLLEEAGISYYFTHDTDLGSLMHLDDSPQSVEAVDPLPIGFTDSTGGLELLGQRWITQVQVGHEMRPGSIRRGDWNFLRPREATVSAATGGIHDETSLELDRYQATYQLQEGQPQSQLDGRLGQDITAAASRIHPTASAVAKVMTRPEYPIADNRGVARHDLAYGEARALVDLEAARSGRRAIRFETNILSLGAGHIFTMVNHPRQDLTPAARLLITDVEMQGEVADQKKWLVQMQAVFADDPYRPAQDTPRPRIFGLQTAVVVGPADGEGARETVSAGLAPESIHVDEHGRVRVQFPWDRVNSYDDQSSAWMRVSQGWAGSGYGLFTIPRVGHEVLIAFIDGDPDNPLIVGRVHNITEPLPHKLPENKTVSTWKSASSPGGDGFNELRFDDGAGREHVYLQAQKDLDTLAKNDAKRAVGNNDTTYVQRESVSGVGGSRTSFVNHEDIAVVGLNKMLHVGLTRLSHVGVEDRTVVGNRWSATVARDLSVDLPKSLHEMARAVGDTVRASATRVFGTVPIDPLTSTQSSPISRFGEQARGIFRDLARVLTGPSNGAGPIPTSITMVDRRIELTTGEASIILDGPNITIQASGRVAIHADLDTLILADRELAAGAIGRVAIASSGDDVVIQSQKSVHLNPYSPGRGVTERRPPDGDPRRDPSICSVCGATKVDGACPALGSHEGGQGGSGGEACARARARARATARTSPKRRAGSSNVKTRMPTMPCGARTACAPATRYSCCGSASGRTPRRPVCCLPKWASPARARRCRSSRATRTRPICAWCVASRSPRAWRATS